MLIKSKFILKKHFGNATVVDGSKIRIDFDSPSEYALVSVPSFVNNNNKSIIAFYFLFHFIYCVYRKLSALETVKKGLRMWSRH